MAVPPDIAQARARVAALKRHHPNRPDLVEDDVRELRVLKAEAYIRNLVSSAPVPTPEQCLKLARLLYPRSGAA